MKFFGLALPLLLYRGGTTLFGQDLYTMPREVVQSRVSSLENLNGLKGQGGRSNAGAKGAAFTSLKAGAAQTLLDSPGSGAIQRIWVTLDDRSSAMLRGLRLRMYWDGSPVPAVDVPFGDFFCAALKPVAFQSALFSNPEGRSFNCYIPMPFKKGAKITLTNDSGKDLELLFFDVDYTLKNIKADELYFHADFHHQKTPVGQDLEILKATGKGRFLGMSTGLNVDPAYGPTWWGEGEVKMFLDGDADAGSPTVDGTGAEDYIGTGWFEGPFAHQYQGCLLADKSQYAFYRFHIPDAIWFYKDIKVTLQQIGGWYAKDVLALQARGVPLQPISLYQNYHFRGLFDQPEALKKADDKDWLNFYRSDDYAITAYYYLNRP